MFLTAAPFVYVTVIPCGPTPRLHAEIPPTAITSFREASRLRSLTPSPSPGQHVRRSRTRNTRGRPPRPPWIAQQPGRTLPGHCTSSRRVAPHTPQPPRTPGATYVCGSRALATQMGQRRESVVPRLRGMPPRRSCGTTSPTHRRRRTGLPASRTSTAKVLRPGFGTIARPPESGLTVP